MKHIKLIILLVVMQIQINAQTYSEDVAEIIYTHCSSCHRPGEIGPFPLTNYDEVKDRAKLIQYVVESKYMPPWKPDPTYQHYQNENYLSDDQIQKISSWVAAGSPRGNIDNEPPFPNFPTGSQDGQPDLVLSFSQAYRHAGNNRDEYRYFVLPTGLTEDKQLVALEMRPGNKPIVHHTLFWADETGMARKEDEKSPEYGFSGGGSAGFLGEQLPGYVPGQKPNVFPPGMSQKIPKGSDLVLQMHYAPTSIDQYDSSSVNLFFAKQPAKRMVYNKIMLPTDLVNGPFIMPPETVKHFHGVYKVPVDVSVLGIWPHCHMLGKSWEVYAKLPSGEQIPLIKIQDWDFNWQGGYYFEKLMVLPKGTEIHGFATYDNTSDNPVNPHQPPKTVTWGEGTADEMYYLPITYVVYQPGDENLVLNSSDFETEGTFGRAGDNLLQSVYPNPASQTLQIQFTLNRPQSIQLNLKNGLGESVVNFISSSHYFQGQHELTVNLPSSLKSGVYLLELVTRSGVLTEKVIVHR